MNNLRTDLTGKKVLVKKEYFKPEVYDLIKDGFLCEGGFGCKAETMSTFIYGKWISNGEEDSITGHDVDSFINS